MGLLLRKVEALERSPILGGPMVGALQRVVRNRELIGARYPGFIVLIWLSAPTMEAVDELVKLLAPVQGKEASVDLLAVILPIRGMPEDQTRRAMAESMKSSSLRRIALVTEGEGFMASIVRSVISGISLLTRTPIPQKVVASFEEVRPWLDDGDAPYAFADLEVAYRELRSQAVSASE
jgi:hypothetical protein